MLGGMTFGRLVDVYIAGRRDAGGSFFAFVNNSNVRNAEEMVNMLNGMLIDGRKIAANALKHPCL